MGKPNLPLDYKWFFYHQAVDNSPAASSKFVCEELDVHLREEYWVVFPSTLEHSCSHLLLAEQIQSWNIFIL